MDTSTLGRRGLSTPRRVGFNLIAVALGLLTGGTGVLMYLGANTTERTVHRLHDIAPALMLLLVFAAACVALVTSGGRTVAPMQQLIAGVAALTAAIVASSAFDPGVIVLVVLIAALAGLHPARANLLKPGRRPSRLLAGLAIAGAIPLTWFAVGQAALQRTAVLSDAHGTEAHYAGMAATALTFAVVALISSLRSEGWRVSAWTAALGVGLFGVASLATPRLPGSFGPLGAAVAVAGAVAFLAAVEFEARVRGTAPAALKGAPFRLPDKL